MEFGTWLLSSTSTRIVPRLFESVVGTEGDGGFWFYGNPAEEVKPVLLTKNKKFKLSNQSPTELVRFASTGQKLSSNERTIIQRLVWQKLTYVDNPAFWSSGLDGVPWKLDLRLSSGPSVPGLINGLVGGVGTFSPQLSNKEETDLFLRMNYARFRLSQEIATARNRKISINKAREMLHWHRVDIDARASLVQSNLPLVLYMAKKVRISGADFDDIVSEGNMALLRAVDGFDCSRGFKFSTYACQAIFKSFSRLATMNNKYRLRFPVEFDPSYEKSNCADVRHEEAVEYHSEQLVKILESNSAGLTTTDMAVIKGRYALGGTPSRKTLLEMGQILGLSKERVRQIQKGAVGKLRKALEERLKTPLASANSACCAAG